MDRITSRTQTGQAIVTIRQRKTPPDDSLENPYEAAVSRLADYEDTGLTPEEVVAMKEELVMLEKIVAFAGGV